MSKYISMPFRIDIGGTGGVSVNTSESQKYIQYISSLLLTSFNERVMRPIYGSQLNQDTFIPIDGTSITETHIRDAIATWLPAISVLKVTVVTDLNTTNVTATILYKLPDKTVQTITLQESNIGDVGDGNTSGVTRFVVKTEEPFAGAFRTKVQMPTGQVIYE